MFTWTPEMIRLMQNANARSEYHRQLAAILAPKLAGCRTLCDAGCGLGALSAALSPYFEKITAADVSDEALVVLRQTIRTRQLTNITPLHCDLLTSEDKTQYDAMVFCFFGGVEQSLAAIRRQCSGKAVLIKKDWLRHRFDPQHRPMKHSSFEFTCDRLQELSIPYDSCRFTLEMGQPLRSVEHARRFFAAYAPNGALPDPERTRALLHPTGRTDFPYYLPARRSLGLIVLDAGTIPDSIEKP